MATQYAISVKNLNFSYSNYYGNTLENITFKIAQGEIFGFLGPSGAGKSTTQKILIGLLDDYEGSVKINGKERTSLNEDFYNEIGVAFEQPSHYLKLTGYENLEFYKTLYDVETKNIDYLLDLVGLTESAHIPVSDYSKGMRVRLNFVRSIIHQPKILFLDEPTSGLDPVNTRKIIDIIKDLQTDGATIFLTTHNMFVAEELCNRVAFMVNGKIEKIDSPKSLKMNYGQKSIKIRYKHDDKSMVKEFLLDTLGSNLEFLDILSNKEIETIHTQEATLDKVFEMVTGSVLI